jgi:hypothetical protein
MSTATPTREELRQAFQCGFQSIDAGDGFSQGFDACLASLGYRKRPEGGCTCSDHGAHGHLPECRWVKA